MPAADRYASISAGDIVSAPAMLSKPWVESSDGRNFVGVDFERQQIADRVRVFGAVQAVQARAAADAVTALRSSSFSIQRDQRLAASPRSGRGMPVGGIMPGAQLADDLFADLRVVAEVRQIELIEQQVRRLQPCVMAGDAVLIDQRALLGNIRVWARLAWPPPAVAPRGAAACGCAAGVPGRAAPGRTRGPPR